MKSQPVPALMKRTPPPRQEVNVEELLDQRFEEFMAAEGLDKEPPTTRAAIKKAMRSANKLGYTNGYKKGCKAK